MELFFLISLQNLLSSLLDSVDKGYQEEVPDLLSSLPGLKRSAYLASQAQLDNLVQRPHHMIDRIHTYIHTYIHNTYMHTYIHTYIDTYVHTYVHTCIRTYIHTHTYIHT